MNKNISLDETLPFGEPERNNIPNGEIKQLTDEEKKKDIDNLEERH